MQIKIFTIPVLGSGVSSISNDLNTFLASHKIVNISKEFVTDRENSMWCFCVDYLEGNNNGNNTGARFGMKVDYSEKLSKEEFERFNILKECRKIVSEDNVIPAYTLFYDADLAQLSKNNLENITPQTLMSLKGFGEKKLEKYGVRFLEMLKDKIDEKNRQSLQSDSGDEKPVSGVLESPEVKNE